MKNITMLYICILTILITLNYGFSWWNNDWERRMEIQVNNPSSQNLYDYQIMFNISYDSNMKNDYSDLRFTWVNGTDEKEIDYWFENYTSDYVLAWVKVPYISTSQNATLYVYYNNPSATYEGDGKKVFLVFDDFSDSELNTTLWYAYGEIYGIENGWLKSVKYNNYFLINKNFYDFSTQVTFKTNYFSETDNSLYWVRYIDNSNKVQIDNYGGNQLRQYYQKEGSWNLINNTYFDWDNNVIYKVRIDYYDDNLFTYINDELILKSLNDEFNYGSIGLFCFGNGENYAYFDNFFIRNFVYPEPIYSILSEKPPTTTTLGNFEIISKYCSDDKTKLITEIQNSTSTIYRFENCEYNCSETLLGTRCNFNPNINLLILFLILLFSFWLIIFFKKIIEAIL